MVVNKIDDKIKMNEMTEQKGFLRFLLTVHIFILDFETTKTSFEIKLNPRAFFQIRRVVKLMLKNCGLGPGSLFLQL
jgi:hypothetical protein